MRKLVASLLLLTSCLAITGCGVYSFTGASISPEIKTISIATFPNQASLVQPSLSQVFTEKLKDKFVSQTNLTQINSSGDISFEGYINISRYDLVKEVALYDFKINHEKVPFLLSSQLFLIPSFDIYHVQKHSNLVTISLESQARLQRLVVAGKGVLRYKKNEDLVIDLSRRHELILV